MFWVDVILFNWVDRVIKVIKVWCDRVVYLLLVFLFFIFFEVWIGIILNLFVVRGRGLLERFYWMVDGFGVGLRWDIVMDDEFLIYKWVFKFVVGG